MNRRQGPNKEERPSSPETKRRKVEVVVVPEMEETDLTKRLQSFLPQIQAANEKLHQAVAENGKARSIFQLDVHLEKEESDDDESREDDREENTNTIEQPPLHAGIQEMRSSNGVLSKDDDSKDYVSTDKLAVQPTVQLRFALLEATGEDDGNESDESASSDAKLEEEKEEVRSNRMGAVARMLLSDDDDRTFLTTSSNTAAVCDGTDQSKRRPPMITEVD